LTVACKEKRPKVRTRLEKLELITFMHDCKMPRTSGILREKQQKVRAGKITKKLDRYDMSGTGSQRHRYQVRKALLAVKNRRRGSEARFIFDTM